MRESCILEMLILHVVMLQAYCAFQVGMDESGNGLCQAVATGNWGCGAFGGDVRLKSELFYA